MAPLVCLNMIIKNESRIIERCLNAAKFAFDFVSITDTGSTDNTVVTVENWLKTNNVQGKVHQRKWINFGASRTESINLAKQAFPQAEYILLLDADMCLVDKCFSREQLKGDSYLLIQTEGALSYRNVRIVKASLPYKSIGCTHEYWGADGAKPPENLDTLYIDDRSDGGCKHDKLERDANLLIQGIKDEPNNYRYFFYLAQTLACMGHYLDAAYWYKRRIEHDGYVEEKFYAMYKLADCYEQMKDYELAHYHYIRAWNHRPWRSEPLCALAKMLVTNDKALMRVAGCMYAKEAIKIAYPSQDGLFINDPDYSYNPWYYLSLGSYYIGEFAQGRVACQRVLEDPKAPEYMKEITRNNLKHYLGK